MRAAPFPAARRHTLHFLREIRPFSPVHLDTEVDLTEIQRLRAERRAEGRPPSLVTYVLYTAARVLESHPDANAAFGGRLRARVARHDTVNGKVTLDRTLGGERVVLSAVFPALERTSLEDVQRRLDHLRGGDAERLPEFAGARVLDRLPLPVGAALFRLGVRPLRRRAETFGTFAVSSLGHRPVDGFHSVGGTTVTLGLGRVVDRPVVRDGEIVVAPVMRLNLTFDHRVIDGAEAADVLAEIRDGLESFTEDGKPREEGSA